MVPFAEALCGLLVSAEPWDGQGLVEHALIFAFIALTILILAVISLQGRISGPLSRVGNLLGTEACRPGRGPGSAGCMDSHQHRGDGGVPWCPFPPARLAARPGWHGLCNVGSAAARGDAARLGCAWTGSWSSRIPRPARRSARPA